MIKNISKKAVLILAGFGLAACTDNTTVNSNRTMTNMNSNTAVVLNSNTNMMNANMMNANMNSNVSSADKEFMNKAAQGGMAEVKLGELAASKAQSPEVKAFGQRMVVDHGKANTDLKALAAEKSVSLPADVSSEQKEVYDKLSKLSGAEFDKEYVKEMVEDHEKDVAEFKKESTGAEGSGVKAFASKTLPTLESHLDQIKTISGKMK